MPNLLPHYRGALAATVTGGNRNDVTRLLPLIYAVPPVRGKRGRPRRRSDVLYALPRLRPQHLPSPGP